MILKWLINCIRWVWWLLFGGAEPKRSTEAIKQQARQQQVEIHEKIEIDITENVTGLSDDELAQEANNILNREKK